VAANVAAAPAHTGGPPSAELMRSGRQAAARKGQLRWQPPGAEPPAPARCGAGTVRVSRNENFSKLKAGYLFPEVRPGPPGGLAR
jgi:hypothetical protein